VSQPEVTRATEADRARVVDTVVAAFRADPAFGYFFPGKELYDEQAPVFAGHLFDARVRHGTVWVVDGGASVAMWDPPSAVPWKQAPLPPETLVRLKAYDAVVHPTLPTTPYWYLGVLATHPDHSGRRLGRAVMAAGLAAASGAGLPAYLETTNPANVALYRRAGWDVVESLAVDTLPVWVMTI
jgi:GNAT superfamily N-acetyltransferase